MPNRDAANRLKPCDEKLDMDLIVTGLPQNSWCHSLAHRDAAEQLRRVAPCPVLSVPDKDLEHYADEITAGKDQHAKAS